MASQESDGCHRHDQSAGQADQHSRDELSVGGDQPGDQDNRPEQKRQRWDDQAAEALLPKMIEVGGGDVLRIIAFEGERDLLCGG